MLCDCPHNKKVHNQLFKQAPPKKFYSSPPAITRQKKNKMLFDGWIGKPDVGKDLVMSP